MIIDEIKELKKSKNAVILAHYYQEGAIQDLADYVGDSLGLAQYGTKVSADVIVLAGVVFMAETAKILNPEKIVLAPDLAAGCSLADNCPADKFAEFIKQYPDHEVVTYVNCSADVKALSDVLCTSSNAVKIINSIPKEKKILFAPDKHLGSYLMKQSGREMVLWQGACMVHDTFQAKKITELKIKHPSALVIAHPECPANVLALADHIGSTASLLNFTQTSPNKSFIVVTEAGILHQMQKFSPEKEFIAAPNSEQCNCAECPYMRMNSLQKIKNALTTLSPQIEIPAETIRKAKIPLERMLALS